MCVAASAIGTSMKETQKKEEEKKLAELKIKDQEKQLLLIEEEKKKSGTTTQKPVDEADKKSSLKVLLPKEIENPSISVVGESPH